MVLEQTIDDLIQAGWHVLDTDFDEKAFQNWKRQAFTCLSALLGPDHIYTQRFNDYVRQSDQKQVMAGGGLLVAAKEEIKKNMVLNSDVH